MEKRLWNKALRVVMGVSLFHLFTFSPLPALADETVDLKALYQEIDDAISQSPQYVAERERKITAYRDSLQKETNVEKRLLMAENLFRLYESYRNDSALHFRLVNKSDLDKRGLIDYYHAWMHVCGEIGSYTQRETIRQRFFKQQDLYRDSVLMVAEEGSEEWYHLKVDILSARKSFQDALEISDQWLQNVTDGTHESAYAAFYRSMIYDRLNNHDMVCYWLGKSALDDIKCAVMNQASLLFLAEHLANDGDAERAQRYMEFAKDCNLSFSPRLRNYQINSVVNVVEKNSHDILTRADLTLKIAVGVIALLLITLIMMCIKRKKQK